MKSQLAGAGAPTTRWPPLKQPSETTQIVEFSYETNKQIQGLLDILRFFDSFCLSCHYISKTFKDTFQPLFLLEISSTFRRFSEAWGKHQTALPVQCPNDRYLQQVPKGIVVFSVPKWWWLFYGITSPKWPWIVIFRNHRYSNLHREL